MSKKKLIFATLGIGALAAVALPFTINANHRDSFGGKHGVIISERMIEKLSKRLDLNKSQRDALFAAADEARPEFRAAREQFRESRRALREYDPTAADYDAKVADLARTHAELASEMTLLVAKMKSTLVEVLTDEQEAKLKKFMERRRDRRGYHHGD